jgi:hypothetical protein
MPVKLTDCSIVSQDTKADAYNKKDPGSITGRDQQRVKIKTTQVRDCKRIVVANEEQEPEEKHPEAEEQDQTPVDEENEQNQQEPTMKDLMEGWRGFVKREGAM